MLPMQIDLLHTQSAPDGHALAAGPRRRLALRRPLVFVDLETTSADRNTARIVSIALVRVAPDGQRTTFHRIVNPGVPIPPDATAVHGITDADVADKPAFAAIAAEALALLDGADLAGYNAAAFDLPILRRELETAGMPLVPGDRQVVDVKTLYHRLRPRTLGDAYRDFVGGALTGAHEALADAEACRAVLEAMVAQHLDLGDTAEALGAPLRDPSWVDDDGKFVWVDGEAVFNFGKVEGRTLRDVAATDRGFLDWMLRKNFSEPVKEIVRKAMAGVFPSRSNGTAGQ